MGLVAPILRDSFFFEPGLEKIYTYNIRTNSGFTQDYELYVIMRSDSKVNLTKYVALDKYYIENVPTDSLAPFTATIKLPQKIDIPGRHEIRIGARETKTLGGGDFGVKTGSEAIVIVIVLYPHKYVEWGFNVENCNVNESCDFSFSATNFGEPKIEKAFGKVEIYNPDSKLIRTAYSDEKSIEPSKTETLTGKISTIGMEAGSYRAVGTLDYDGNTSQKEAAFLVGKLSVDVTDHKKVFYANATEKMEITISSGWNSKIDYIYADVEILNNDNIVLDKNSCRTISESLNPWQSKNIYGYFSTVGLTPQNYSIRIILNYEGAQTVKHSTIQLIPLEKAPEVEKPLLSKYLLENTAALWIIIMVILIANIAWMVLRNKKSKEKDQKEKNKYR